MAITSVNQVGPGRTATAKLNGRIEVRTHTQPYRVITDNRYDTSYEVQSAFPPIGSPHISDPHAFLVSKDPVSDTKSPTVWMVPLVYSTERPRATDPTSDPVDIEWDTESKTEPYLYDSSGNAMLNTAGFSYGEAIKDEKAYWTVVCTSNQLFIPDWIDYYKNCYNSDSCSIDGRYFEAGQCRVRKLHISRWQTREDYRYRVLTITIKITDNPTINTASGMRKVYGWSKNVIDEGLRCKWASGAGSLFGACVDSHGRPVSKAAALDGNGFQFGSDSGTKAPKTLPTPAQIIYNSFDILVGLPFSALPLN